MTDSKLLPDHFTPWSASRYHLLHPFMQPIMPTTIFVGKKHHISRLFGGLSLEPEARKTWATSRKANKNWKNKTKSSKTKKTKLLGECLILTQKIVFVGLS
jgi:hypothetical protein